MGMRKTFGLMMLIGIWLGLHSTQAAQEILFLGGSQWKYNDSGTDLGTNWSQRIYTNEAAWSNGLAPFGYGDTNPPPTTTNYYGTNASQKFPTYYFRKSIVITNLAEVATVNVAARIDDGAVLHLNGVEYGRHRLTNGVVTYNTYATNSPADTNEADWIVFSASPTLLVEGTNVFAVEVHQVGPSSSDLRFDMTASVNRVAMYSGSLIPLGSTWKYNDTGTNLGTTWRQVQYTNEEGWASGPSQLGYGGDGEVTTISYGGNPTNRHMTTYFRHSVVISATGLVSAGSFLAQVDDGAVLHLNGQEVWRHNMPAGPIVYSNAALAGIGASFESVWHPIVVPGSYFRSGTNVFAVEVHQNGPASSDLRWNFTGEIDASTVPTLSGGGVVINELMYHPEDIWGFTNDSSFVELYNAGLTNINLSSYRFDNGIDASFPPGTIITAGTYFVLCENFTRFTNTYPGVTNVIGTYAGTLSSSGERITLSREEAGIGVTNWITVDTVDFHDGGLSDGEGHSLELIHPGFAVMDEDYAGAWAESRYRYGTPGWVNSAADSNAPPVVGEVEHDPPLPFAGSTIRITAALSDRNRAGFSSVALLYRQDAVPTNVWSSVAMSDGGYSGDLLAADGTYSAMLPAYGGQAFTNGTLIEYRIHVTANAGGGTTHAPAVHDGGVTNGPYSYLCYIGEDAAFNGEYPAYHILMTQTNRTILDTRDHYTNILLDGAFVTSDGKLYQNCGLRYRGGSSRTIPPYSYRVEFPRGHRYKNHAEINLIHDMALDTHMSFKLLNESGYGCLASESWLCRVWLNQTDLSLIASQKVFVLVEKVDSAFISKRYDDPIGNIYGADGDDYRGDLTYTNNFDAYPSNYFVTTNNPVDVWTELSNLCWTVNLAPAQLLTAATNRVNTRQWARTYALAAALDNTEAGYFSWWFTYGDELRLYADPSDGQFDLIPWDMSEIIGTNGVIWYQHPIIANFLYNPPMLNFYRHDLREVLETQLSPSNFLVLADGLGTAAATNRSDWTNNMNIQRTKILAQLGGGPGGGTPAAPSALAATNVQATRIVIRWTDNSSNEEWFEVDRSGNGRDWAYHDYTRSNVTSFTDFKVKPGEDYYYRVRACYELGESAYSASIVATTLFSTTIQALTNSLRITEVMYNPLSTNGDVYEFIELKNVGGSPLDLGGLVFDEARYAFPTGTTLAAGAFFVLVRDAVAFTQRYPAVTFHGEYQSVSGLSDNGERLWIEDANGIRILDFTFEDGNGEPQWYPTTDGQGYSLVPTATNGNFSSPLSWRASANLYGSPGADDPAPSSSGIVINEVLAHSDPPFEDAIEIRNIGTGTINIAGWYLSNSATNLMKYRITNATLNIPAGGYHVFYEGTSFNQNPTSAACFEISSLGDEVHLSAVSGTNLNGYRSWVEFAATENATSLGRHLKSDGTVDFVRQVSRSFGMDNPGSVAQFRTGTGLVNPGPLVGPIVIREIQADPDGSGAEYLMLENITGTNVPLYDTARPSNTWIFSEGISFSFSPGNVLTGGTAAFVVSDDVATFRTDYGITNPTTQIFGPFDGSLSDSGEDVVLSRPDVPETNGFVPYIVAELIDYRDTTPWPLPYEDAGSPIRKGVATNYGNDAAIWSRVPLVQFAQATATRFEGVASTNIEVILTPALSATVTVNYTVGGSASAGSDYTLSAGSVTFSPSQTNRTIALSLLDDGTAEADETVVISLSSVSSTSALLPRVGGRHQHTETLVDRDSVSLPAPLISPSGTNGFFASVSISMSTPYTGGTIYYTDDGSLPTAESRKYKGVFSVDTSTRIQARTFLGSYTGGPVASALYLRQTPNYSGATTNDADGDGMPDSWETTYFGSQTSSVAGGDWDADGFENFAEFVAGTDPSDYVSVFELLSLNMGTSNRLTWSSVTGKTYSVYRSTNLKQGWQRISPTNGLPGESDRENSFADPSGGTNVFYSIRVR